MSVETSQPRSWLGLVVFLLIVMGVGSVIGFASAPDAWYAGLAKAPWNPPNWVFAPAWFALYVMIAIAGWRSFSADPSSGQTIAWILQMILNWAWSPTWFTLHLTWPAFVLIIAILALVLAFIVISWRRGDKVSAWLFVPYAAWVGFASTLNLAIAVLN
ncbi:MAG: TspO/MBR family protein [Devosia sp.]